MNDALNIAIFADFENIAIGARDAHFPQFEIDLVLERLLDKGKVLSKKAYADWERYRIYCKAMHEAGFELCEVPHVSYSGKNSADIHMVVDALDLCYTRPHIDTFVVLSGDSDFSPLVHKLRLNDKIVIGVGVKNSSSNLLIESCDEFIYSDDLVRRRKGSSRKKSSRRGGRGRNGRMQIDMGVVDLDDDDDDDDADIVAPAAQPSAQQAAAAAPRSQRGAPVEEEPILKFGNKEEALDYVLEIAEALFQERDGNLWGSMIKQTLKRRRPNFDETYYGYRTFTELLMDGQVRGLLELQKDEKSGGFLIVGFGPNA